MAGPSVAYKFHRFKIHITRSGFSKIKDIIGGVFYSWSYQCEVNDIGPVHGDKEFFVYQACVSVDYKIAKISIYIKLAGVV